MLLVGLLEQVAYPQAIFLLVAMLMDRLFTLVLVIGPQHPLIHQQMELSGF